MSITSDEGKRRRKKHRKLNRREMSLNRMENFKKEVVTDSHIISLDVLCARLETNAKTGLTAAKAKARLLETGPNALTPSRKDPEILKFVRNMVQGFSMLLWIGALLCFIGVLLDYLFKQHFDEENFILGWVLIVIIVLTGIFTYCQERKSSKIMNSFANMIPENATVIRGGEKLVINVKELVVGDLVDIQFGDRIPADIRITKSQGFKVDNSSLTGENEPLLRTNQCTNENFLETRNIAFFSTNAVEGTAQGIVIMCGDMTVMGRIAGLTARLHPTSTPIARELHRFIKIVTVWACFLGFTFGISSIVMGYAWIDAALFIIGIIVANVPEGLSATVTVSLTVTAKKMAAKNCLVKNLEAVETLGSTSVICSDKTGTLTQNRMTVCHMWYNNSAINADISADQYDAKRYIKDEGFELLMRCATLCNRAEFASNQQKKPIMQRAVMGDASEAAIFKFVELSKCHGHPDDFRKAHPKLIEIPFSSTTKYQVSVHGLGRECLVVMKGAPERVLDKCTTIYYNDTTVELTTELRGLCDRSCLELAARGERVLGFCDLKLKDTYSIAYPFSIDPMPNFPLEGFRFVGFISLVDPPRPQVHDAVDRCRTAGIKVVMVTGDHPVTAKSIARDVGIITASKVDEAAVQISPSEESKGKISAIVVPGNTLKELSLQELDHILSSYNEIVFARTSPTQKLQIVEGFQRIGMIVAVTGDGVNDAPALKKSDIGIAMGISGSEVSKQSADMVLLDDNFASIVTGIEEGRKIFDNLKKSIVYILTSNVAELMPVLAFIILNIPLPIGIFAILCIDILTDMMPAISLAYEKAESNIMARPPRNPNKDNLVTFRLYFLAYGHIGIIEAYAGFFVYFMIMFEHGFKPIRLLGLRSEWDSNYINDLQDSFGHEWTYNERKELEYTCSTAYMIAIVICQWGNVIACKTRHNSIVRQKMNNWILNMSIVFETILAAMLSFIPMMNYLKFYPVKIRWCLYAVPFSIIIIMFDEFRKGCIRKYPTGYFYKETYY